MKLTSDWSIGLDQELSMPDDSFVLKFFEWMKLYLSVGPPIYLVVNNTHAQLDLSLPEDQNLLCLGLENCREDSVAGQVILISDWSIRIRTHLLLVRLIYGRNIPVRHTLLLHHSTGSMTTILGLPQVNTGI